VQFKEFVQTDEFKEYRRREIEKGAEFVKQVWTVVDTQYIRGALDMLSKIIRIPESFASGQDTKDFMGTLIARDFAEFETKFLRKHLEVSDD
jgi:hypothetical protein